MQLKHYYYRFTEAIPPRICDDIVRIGESSAKMKGMTGGVGDDGKKPTEAEVRGVEKIRKSTLSWLSDKWLYELFHPFIYHANKEAGWNFHWESSEQCQFTRYSPGQFYHWHCDCQEDTYKDGLMRKLSVTVSLSSPTEYPGGELEFDFRNGDPDKKRRIEVCSGILPKGSLVVFPSFVWHRVRPVLRGTRRSLVIWNLGRAFK